MGFFPHVNRGDEIEFNIVLENTVRDMVNRFLASGAGKLKGPFSIIRLKASKLITLATVVLLMP